MTTDLATVGGAGVDFGIVQERLTGLRAFQKAVMADGEDYMTFAGGKKPSLLKGGAEKMMMAFGLVVGDIEFTRDIMEPNAPAETIGSATALTPGRAEFEVKVTLLSARTGTVAGIGVGSASSAEKKYVLARASYKHNSEEPAVVLADQTNTLRKMAKKRAMVDAVLTATMASGLFTQDVEDMDAPPAEGKAAAPTAATGDAERGLCPKHRVPFVHRVGTSKAGKDYDFWACPEKDGSAFCKCKPAEVFERRITEEDVVEEQDNAPFVKHQADDAPATLAQKADIKQRQASLGWTDDDLVQHLTESYGHPKVAALTGPQAADFILYMRQMAGEVIEA